jgi:hypothetical protein
MQNSYHQIKVHTGPTLVTAMAEKFEAAGLIVSSRGTEHVHLLIEAPVDAGIFEINKVFLLALMTAHGTTFGFRNECQRV